MGGKELPPLLGRAIREHIGLAGGTPTDGDDLDDDSDVSVFDM